MRTNENPLVIVAVSLGERLVWALMAIVAPFALYAFTEIAVGPMYRNLISLHLLFRLDKALTIAWLPWVIVLYVALVATAGPPLWHWYRDRSYRAQRWNLGPRERYPALPDAGEEQEAALLSPPRDRTRNQ